MIRLEERMCPRDTEDDMFMNDRRANGSLISPK